jgi:hypothetical protein
VTWAHLGTFPSTPFPPSLRGQLSSPDTFVTAWSLSEQGYMHFV